MNIVEAREWTNPETGKTKWFVKLDDGTEAVSFAKVAPGPLLPGWSLEPPKQEGWKPMLKGPAAQRTGGGAPAAFRNTKEGFLLEQDNIHRSVALQQAVGWVDVADLQESLDKITAVADAFYAWLRKDVSAPPGAAPVRDGLRTGDGTAGTGPRPAVGADTPSDGGGGIEYPQVGSGKPPSASATPPPPPPSHAEKWSPYGNPEKCAHQLVPGIKGWLKCVKCGRADKEAAWA